MKRLILAAVLTILAVVCWFHPYGIQMTGLCLLGYAVLLAADVIGQRKGFGRRWRKVLIGIGVAVFVLLAAGMTAIGLGGRSQWEEARQSDYAVVLGAQIWGDQPSPTLQRRLNVGLEYLEENPDGILIVSGGQGPDEAYTEASIMEEYLRQQGADMDRVIQEDQASDTRENLRNSAEIAESMGLDADHPTIITSEFHLCRAKYIAKTLGLEPSGLSSPTTPVLLRLNYQLREVFAFVKAWLVAAVS